MKKNILIFLVSGGPDSMFVFNLVYNFLNGKKIIDSFNWDLFYFLDRQNCDIVVLHYNHKVRKESDNEQKFLEKYFRNLQIPFYVGINKDFENKTENFLRKKRREWIFDKIKSLNFDKKYNHTYLITGHNLTDRIETTLLNMLRGCRINGFLNMNIIDKVNNFENVYIFRPLLNIEKSKIQNYCDKLNIPYFIDKTNFDSSISKRNKIRKIINQLSSLANITKDGDNLFFHSWRNIYEDISSLKSDIKKFDIKLVYKDFCNNLGVNFIKEIIFDKNIDINLKDIVQLFKTLGIYKNIDKNVLYEFLKFFKNSRGGYKYINGLYIFKTVGRYFVMDKYPDFGFSGKVLEVKNGVVIRYPKKGDKYKGKLLTKYFNKKKIPIFLRGWIKLKEKNNQIIEILS